MCTEYFFWLPITDYVTTSCSMNLQKKFKNAKKI